MGLSYVGLACGCHEKFHLSSFGSSALAGSAPTGVLTAVTAATSAVLCLRARPLFWSSPHEIFRVPQVEVRPVTVQPARHLGPPLITSNLEQRMGCELVGPLSQVQKLEGLCHLHG